MRWLHIREPFGERLKMPNKCVVPGCHTGYRCCKDKLSTFSAPKNDELRKKWEKAIQPKTPLMPKHVVYEKHFTPEQIIQSYKLKDDTGNILVEVRSSVS